MIGRKLAHFEIVEKLGEGGMGAVYKARDHHLDRFVALKVLLPDKVSDPERKRRFVQEAKAASALNHPNIVTIHDIASDNGVDYIAMEYVAGRTLDALIPRQGMQLNEALRLAIQMADGLAKAHAAGITHRDLKPSNIMVDADGRVKLLDFGLAKLTDRGESGDATLTTEGSIVGTVAYMSPEQAEGQPVDARSDIFSFGAVLYEMLTGQRAFHGDTPMSTLAAVIHKEPKPVSELSPVTPRDLDRIITRCLRKDRTRRTQHMDDVRLALEDLKEESDSGRLAAEQAPVAKTRKSRRWAWMAAAVSMGVAGGAFGVWWWTARSAGRPAELAMRPLTADSGLTTHPVLSRDGKMIAYASDRATQKNLDIWVHPLTEGGQPIRLTTHEADDSTPDFSPDGGLVAFRSERDGGGIYLVPTHGGDERLLVRGKLPRFSPDGKSIAYCVGCDWLGQSKIYTIPVSGGAAKQQAADVPWASLPVFSSDGRHILFEGAPAANDTSHDWWVAPVEGGPSVKTGAGAILAEQTIQIRELPKDLNDGRVLFTQRGQIWGLDLAGPEWKAHRPARPLTAGNSPWHVRAGAGSRMVFVNTQSSSHLWKLKVDLNKGKALGEMEPLPHSGGVQTRPSSSADGRLLAYSQQEPSGDSVRLRDLATAKESTLVSSRGRPKVSPDGSKVAYGVFPDSIYLLPSSGGESELLVPPQGKFSTQPYAWTSDGKKMVYWLGKPIRFALLDPGTRQSTDLLAHPKYDIHGAELSPDQRWVAFTTPTGRRKPLWITAYRNGKAGEEKEWIPVSEDRDDRPWWSPDGNLLYTVSLRDGASCIWAQRLDPLTKRPIGEAFAVHHIHGARVKVSSAGLAYFGPAILPDGLIFSLDDESGNVWIAERKL
jgi:Tol biopolymer transport system component/tRNA A-37 threonylcarbamoyl transferase component Bud32